MDILGCQSQKVGSLSHGDAGHEEQVVQTEARKNNSITHKNNIG